MKFKNERIIFLIAILFMSSLLVTAQISEALSWIISFKEGTWTIKALSDISPKAGEIVSFIINPQGQILSEGVKAIKEEIDPKLATAIDTILDPTGKLTREALAELAKKDPKTVSVLGEVLTVTSQLEELGFEGETRLNKEGLVRELDNFGIIPKNDEKQKDISFLFYGTSQAEKLTPEQRIILKRCPECASLEVKENDKEKEKSTITIDFSTLGGGEEKEEQAIFVFNNKQIGIHSGLIEFERMKDEKGNIIVKPKTADFFVGDSGSLKFGEEEIYLVRDTRVLWNEKDGYTLTNTRKDSVSASINLAGRGFVISDFSRINVKNINKILQVDGVEFDIDDIHIKRGKVFLIHEGYLFDEQVVAKVYGRDISDEGVFHFAYEISNKGEVLFAYPDTDLSNYKGNYIKQTEDSLKVETVKGGIIKLKVEGLGLGESTYKKGYNIFDVDQEDYFVLRIENGDGIVVKNRRNENKIPLINHISKGGYGLYKNGRLSVEITNGGELNVLPKIEPPQPGRESIAFTLSPSQSEYKVVFSSADQYALFKKDEEIPFVTLNKFKVPIGESREANLVQDIDFLKEKYPNAEFMGSKKDASPFLVQLTDTYLSENPEAQKNIKIEFDSSNKNVFMSSKDGDWIHLSGIFPVLDPYADEMTKESIRELSPIQVIKHENEHLKDLRILTEEVEAINKDPIVSGYIKRIAKAPQNEKEKLWKEIENRIGKPLMVHYNDLIEQTFKEMQNDESFVPLLDSIQERLTSLDLYEEISKLKQSATRLSRKGLVDDAGILTREANILEAFIMGKKDALSIISTLKSGISKKRAVPNDLEELDSIFNTLVMVSTKKDVVIKPMYKETFIESMRKLRDFVENVYGLPSVYSMRLYEAGDLDQYLELPAVYSEELLLEKKQKASLDNPNEKQRRVYQTLTQLAYDSGKISKKECEEILGGVCQKGVIYKFGK